EITLRKNSVKVTFLEVVIPFFLLSVLIFENNLPNVLEKKEKSISKDHYDCGPYQTVFVYYVPETEFTNKVMRNVKEQSICALVLIPKNDPSELDRDLEYIHLNVTPSSISKRLDFTNKSVIFGGVVFRARRDRDLLYNYPHNSFHINIKPAKLGLSPNVIYAGDASNIRKQLKNIASFLQLINKAALFVLNEQNFARLVSAKNVTDHFINISDLKPIEDSDFFLLFAFFVIFAVTTPLIVLIARIVDEKSSGLRELMTIFGVRDHTYFFSLFVIYFSMLLLIALMLIGAVMHHFNAVTLFLLLFTYSASSVLFTMAFTTLFQSRATAVASFLFVWFGSVDLMAVVIRKPGPNTIYSILRGDVSLPDWVHLAICCFATPNYGLNMYLSLIEEGGIFDGRSVKITDLFKMRYKYTHLCPGSVLIAMTVSCFVWLIFLWYIKKVWPWQRTSLPFHFPITQFFHKEKERSKSEKENYIYFEPVEKELKDGIRFESLRKEYDQGLEVLCDISFHVHYGQITTILGRSGSGKTTLIRTAIGLERPTTGQILFDGYSVAKHRDYITKNVGVCTQKTTLFSQLTVEEHVYFFSLLKGFNKETIEDEIQRIVSAFHLLDFRKWKVASLSASAEKLLQLGIGFIGKPKMLILDEPTTGLDVETRRKIWDRLLSVKKESLILMTTSLIDEAEFLADRIAILSQGEIKCCGSINFLKRVFDVGYQLKMTKTTHFKPKACLGVLKRILATVQVRDDTESLMIYEFNQNECSKLPMLFDELEALKEQLGVKRYSVNTTSMEDIFIKADNMLEETMDPTKKSSKIADKGATIPALDIELNPKKFQKFFALLLKRYHSAKREIFVVLFYLTWVAFFTYQMHYILHKHRTTVIESWKRGIDYHQFGYAPSHKRVIGICGGEKTYCEIVKRVGTSFGIDISFFRGGKMKTYVHRTMTISPKNLHFAVRKAKNSTYFIYYNDEAIYSKLIAIILFYNSVLQEISQSTTNLVTFSVETFKELNFEQSPAKYFYFQFPREYQNFVLEIVYVFLKLMNTTFSRTVVILLEYVVFFSQCLPVHDFAYNLGLISTYTSNKYYCQQARELSKKNCTEISDTSLFKKCCIESEESDIDGINSMLQDMRAFAGISSPAFVTLICVSVLIAIELVNSMRFLKTFVDVAYKQPPYEDVDVKAEREKTLAIVERNDFENKSLVAYNLTKKMDKVLIVDHLSFTVENKDSFAILGLSNSGKTTVIQLIIGEIPPTSGQLRLESLLLSERRDSYRRHIGYCPQNVEPFVDNLSGIEMLYLFARLRGVQERKIKEVVEDIVKYFEMENYVLDVVTSYTLVNKRKLALAIALIGWPSLLVLDEPTFGIDFASKKRLWRIIEAWKRRKECTLILASHSLDECEILSERIAFLVRGEFRCLGSAQHLRSEFGGGFMIVIRLSPDLTYQQEIEALIAQLLPSAKLRDSYNTVRHYHISERTTNLAQIFAALENIKSKYKIEDYKIVESTLERFFLSFAKKTYAA
ncbi:ATP-binding cassette sub-family A member 1-like protein, partial [Dinothrombium tinctorium]